MANPRSRAADHPYFDAPFVALAHRGGSLYGPNQGRENTVHAFSEAAALGYRYFETDVHTTADGVLVAFHDERLDRVTDGRGLIAETDWSDLRTVRVGSGDAIPTLAELFETFPEARFNIDIKAPGAVAPLAETISSHTAQDRVCVGSFDSGRLRAFRRLAGDRVATSVSPVGIAWNAFVPVLPRWVNDAGLALQMPVSWPIAGREVRLLTTALVERAHAAGKQVHVWTIDDAAQMHGLIDLGVDGIVSDRIDVLKSVCQERGLWS